MVRIGRGCHVFNNLYLRTCSFLVLWFYWDLGNQQVLICVSNLHQHIQKRWPDGDSQNFWSAGCQKTVQVRKYLAMWQSLASAISSKCFWQSKCGGLQFLKATYRFDVFPLKRFLVTLSLKNPHKQLPDLNFDLKKQVACSKMMFVVWISSHSYKIRNKYRIPVVC